MDEKKARIETAKLCDFSKEAKEKLVDIDKNQEQLCAAVKRGAGLYFGRAYRNRILYTILPLPASFSAFAGS